jgi:dipeptidyl aminopeptidase/acylaminoacyl peptidase
MLQLRIAASLIAGAALAAPVTASAQRGGGARPLTLQTMVEGVRIGDVQFSPDGKSLILVSNRSGRSKVWIMDRNGGNARLMLDDQGSESAPAWSPDGQWVAFLRRGSGSSDIWVVHPDGSGLRQVTRTPDNEGIPSWSPDGKRIAFIAVRDSLQDVFVANVADGAVRQLTHGANPWDEPRWRRPEWSPDGRWIVYVSNRSDPNEAFGDDLWLLDAQSGATEKLTADLSVMSSPRWSPDGRHIAFNAMKKSEFWYGDMSDAYVVEMPSQKVRRIAMEPYVSDRNGSISMEWSPSSDRLYFRYEWEGDVNLWTVPLESGVATKLTYEEGAFGEIAVNPDGSQVAYVRSTPTRAGELMILDLAGGTPKQATSWDRGFTNLQAPRKITFRSQDGHYILGYLYLPPNFDPAKKYPAALQVHGGGNNANGNGFHVLEHLIAHSGYMVLAIEYRGSAGHGRAFQDLSYGDWAAGQGWDAVYAARFLKSLPYSNGKVGIYGGSYGGITTLAALTRDSAPFDAAAPLYGIYDWQTAYENGDVLMRSWVIEGHKGFRPGEKPELYERTATIRHLDKIRSGLPFLIIHGEQDRRAPYGQSMALVDALKANGNPVEFLSYPGEQHGFRQPQNRIDAYGRLLKLFGRYLKGAK